jgi:hypothetical protein
VRGRRHERLDATSRETAAHDWQEPAATFLWAPQAPLSIALLLHAGYPCLELVVARGLELAHVLGLFFGWARRGACSFAFNL